MFSISPPNLIDGCIWDWVDQGLRRPSPNGIPVLSYGGDFDDFPNDNNFCMNGLVDADRKPHPSYLEVQKVHQPVKFRLTNLNFKSVLIENQFTFLNLEHLDARWELSRDSEVVQQGTWEHVNVPAGSKKELPLPLKLLPDQGRSNWHLRVWLEQPRETSWPKSGQVVAWEQFQLRNTRYGSLPQAVTVATQELPDIYQLSVALPINKRTAAITTKQTGLLGKYYTGGRSLFVNPAKLNFWRAPTDNDGGWKIIKKLGIWKSASAESKLRSIRVQTDNSKRPIVTAIFDLKKPQAQAQLEYQPETDYALPIRATLTPKTKLPMPLRFGLQFEIPKEFQNIAWLGRGPHESYTDRFTSAPFRKYQATASKWSHSYLKPLESGNRTSVDRITFSNNASEGWQISAVGKPFNASAWPYRQADLESTTHAYLLQQRDATRQLSTSIIDRWKLAVIITVGYLSTTNICYPKAKLANMSFASTRSRISVQPTTNHGNFFSPYAVVVAPSPNSNP